MDERGDSADADKPADVIRRTSWKLWFIVSLWVVLVLQGAVDIFARTTGNNAFPTIAMPGFGANNIGANGDARVTDRKIEVIDATGVAHEVAPESLLAPLPVASAVSTLNRIFDPSAKAAPALPSETIGYLKHQSELLGLNSDPIGLRLVWQPEIFDMKTLQRTPAGEPTVREVEW